MVEPFIKNHQFNFIKKQVNSLRYHMNTVNDEDVIKALKYNAEHKVIELFPEITNEQFEILKPISQLQTEHQFEEYIMKISNCLEEFPKVSDQQIKKLFRKNKKLKLPDLQAIDYKHLTFLGWNDTGSFKKFFVYELDEKTVGIEGQFTPSKKKGVCSICNNLGEVSLITVESKTKGTQSNYRSIGNYMCLDSDECNSNITDITYLENFFRQVLGE